MTRDITNSDDIIDSRDVIERLEELSAELEAAYEVACPEDKYDADAPRPAFSDWVDDVADSPLEEALFDEANEYRTLKALADEAEQYASDWRYGETLIRHDYFTDYCIELIQDIGDLPKDIPGYLAIDWEKTADNLKVDYAAVEFDGVTYYIRSC